MADSNQIIGVAGPIVVSLLQFIHDRQAQGLPIPTKDEALAHLVENADSLATEIDAWEAANPVPPDGAAEPPSP